MVKGLRGLVVLRVIGLALGCLTRTVPRDGETPATKIIAMGPQRTLAS